MSYGAQVKLGIAREVTPNSWVTDPNSYHGLGFLVSDVGLEKQELISTNLINRFEEGAVYSGITKVAGTIEVELTPKSLLASIGAVVSNSATVVDSGSVRNWTFFPDTQDYSSTFVQDPWSIYQQFADSNSADLFYDCQFSQLELQFAKGQFARNRITVVGGTRLSTGVGSMNVQPLATDIGRLFPWNVTSISLGGSAVGQASDITVTLNNNIDGLYTINGTLAPFKFTRTAFRQVTVKGTLYMTDRSILNAFANETQQQLLITSINTRAAIQSGYFDTFLVDVPQFKVTAFKPGASGPGEVAVSFQGRGVLDPSSNYSIRFVLQNTYQLNL